MININLKNGDCLEVLKTLQDKSIDLILQDPPYNTTACKWEWDIMTKIDEFWAEWKRVIKDNGAIIMTASQPFTSKLVMSNISDYKYQWTWVKTRNSNPFLAKRQPLRVTEDVLVFGGARVSYFPQMTVGTAYRINRFSGGRIAADDRANRSGFETSEPIDHRYPTNVINIANKNVEAGLHPTQKPVALMEYLIKTYTNEGDTVFDGFMGSGTTGVGCKNLNRDFIGVELNEEYFKIAERRIIEERINIKSSKLKKKKGFF